MSNNEIQVSVCIVTYNQQDYIAECLESLISQETNFKFEIIVGEDCSTDGTREIIQSYVEKYPDLIVPLFYDKNVGAVENIKQVYKLARGKYIAHLDGDDLAMPNKLQIQFDILEGNLDCNICSHDVIRVNSNGERGLDWTYLEKKYNLYDLYHKLPFFAHSSKMFRNKYNKRFWDNLLNKSYILDIDIHIENSIDGNIYHVGQFLGAYRVDVGVSTKSNFVNPILPLGAKRVFDKGLVLFQHDTLKLSVIRELYAVAMLQCAYNYAIYDGDTKLFKEYVCLSLKQKNIGFNQFVFKLATYAPWLFFAVFRLRSKFK